MFLNGVEEIFCSYLLNAAFAHRVPQFLLYCYVNDSLEIGAGELLCSLCYFLKVYLLHRLFLQYTSQNFFSCLKVRWFNENDSVKAAWPSERRVDAPRCIGSSQD